MTEQNSSLNYPLGGMLEPYDIAREAELMEEKIEPIKTYILCLKSHCEAPDFEVSVGAVSTEDAIKELRKQYGKHLAGIDDMTLIENLSLDTAL